MRILVIEDDVSINKALKICLKKEGYAVDSYVDSEEGLRHALTNAADYDLMIIDIMMPGVSGIEICHTLRSKNIFVPIMMLTALSNPKDKVVALDAGADDYVTKPFSIEELNARVRALLRRPKTALPAEIKVGDLILISSEKKLLYKGKEIPLTLKEFRILEYLLSYPDQVITKDQLLNHVWDEGFTSFSNTVEVHINSLRKKLRSFGIKDLISTIRGIGYRARA